MPRIRPLAPLVINQIAAGEVIERPASVVKELLENSLDALATRVEIDVEEGGAELIRIVDDGEGIVSDDLVLAVTSHATSKIATADDLFRVQTMGFRGEALASIASVSRMRLRSRPAEASTGHELEVVGGDAGPVQPCGCPPGTQIEVRQLFLNTPVRRKFLRTPATEFGHVSEQFTRIALANPRLHAVLRHNGRVVYELPPTSQLADRLRLFFGSDLAEALIPVEAAAGDVRLWGYVAHPDQSKATRKGQYLFLNGRYIQDRSLQHALGEAYRGLLMVGRYPVCVLFLEAPPDSVDVNVHPTKAEVRFRDGQSLYRLLLGSLRKRFLSMDLGGTMRLPGQNRPSDDGGNLRFAPAPPPDPQRQRALQLELAAWAKDQLQTWRPPADDAAPGESASDEWTSDAGLAPAANVPADPGFGERYAASGGTAAVAQSATAVIGPGIAIDADAWLDDAFAPATFAEREAAREDAGEESAAEPVVPTPTAPAPAAQSAQPIAAPTAFPASKAHVSPAGRVMQIHDCYLLLETEAGLTVIDQHALHERILYEQLRRRVLNGAVESQKLLVPQTLELTPPEVVALLEQADVLRQLGYGLEDFGGTTLLLTAYPTMLRRADHMRLVRDLAEQLLEAGRTPTRRDLLDSLLHTMSCRGAIKAGQRLTPEEMDALLAQRTLVEDSHHCPHGRPTSLVLSREDLDRQFGRLGAERQ